MREYKMPIIVYTLMFLLAGSAVWTLFTAERAYQKHEIISITSPAFGVSARTYARSLETGKINSEQGVRGAVGDTVVWKVIISRKENSDE